MSGPPDKTIWDMMGPEASLVVFGGLFVLLIGGVVASAIWNRRERKVSEDLDARISEARARMNEERLRQAEAATAAKREVMRGRAALLSQKDARFTLERFLEHARTVFILVQDAWFRRDLTPLRPYLSDGTYRRFAVQLQLMAFRGIRDAITDLEVLEVELMEVTQSASFDTAHVRVAARLRDTDVPAATSDEAAREAAGREPQERFEEVWSFVRRPGAQTCEEAQRGRCPNCGAPFSGGATNDCSHCGAIINSGHYDWVLAEITQGVEVIPHAEQQVEGLSKAREADPGLSAQVIEDRASLIFWKWIEAVSLGQPRRVSKLCTPGQLADLEEEVGRLRSQGLRTVVFECAVGAVRTQRLQMSSEGFEHAEVEILWSSRQLESAEGEAPMSYPASEHHRSTFVLARRAGARAPEKHGLSTSRCARCNAALTDSLSDTCDYCGAVLSAAEGDWVLAALRPSTSSPPRQPVVSATTEQSSRPPATETKKTHEELLAKYRSLPYRSYADRYETLKLLASELVSDKEIDVEFAKSVSYEIHHLRGDLGSSRAYEMRGDIDHELAKLVLGVARRAYPPRSKELVPFIESVLYYERQDERCREELEEELRQIRQ